VEIVKRGQSKPFREVGKKIMDESMKMNNSRTLHQIVKDVLKEIINDILQIDLTGMDRHTREEADAKQLIKKGLTSKPYLYEITELGEHFEYIIVENDSSQRIGDKMEYPEFPAII
ncbi:12175_t:CDS:2, partial [Funneliformis geosporum]